jgi:hypothetical protein
VTANEQIRARLLPRPFLSIEQNRSSVVSINGKSEEIEFMAKKSKLAARAAELEAAVAGLFTGTPAAPAKKKKRRKAKKAKVVKAARKAVKKVKKAAKKAVKKAKKKAKKR